MSQLKIRLSLLCAAITGKLFSPQSAFQKQGIYSVPGCIVFDKMQYLVKYEWNIAAPTAAYQVLN